MDLIGFCNNIENHYSLFCVLVPYSVIGSNLIRNVVFIQKSRRFHTLHVNDSCVHSSKTIAVRLIEGDISLCVAICFQKLSIPLG